MRDVDPAAIAESLYQRRDSGVLVPYEPRDLDWSPRPNDCHNNTDRYVIENAGHRSVRGWRILDYSDVGLARFLSHSVIEDAEGHLFDITPTPSRNPPRFLVHEGPEGQFEFLVTSGYSQLTHPIGTK
jgi:hypothetical protein